MKVRTRFSPSPTGSLHIGGIRTALWCYAFAKKNSGEYILRIEDTDRNRFVEGVTEQIPKTLEKYGLKHDEYYVQSERLDVYKKYAEELVTKGLAYYAFETKEELEALRKKAQETKDYKVFRSKYRDLNTREAKEKVEAGEEYSIRQKMPDSEEISFHDELQGDLNFNTREVGDAVLLKSDGFPTYHLAVVVDDHEMSITHVFRGMEWIPSIPRHVLIYRAFGWDIPKHIHFPLILDPDGGKLSKRKGSVAAEEFLKEGYLPEAISNFLMLLGWASPEERVHGEKEREVYTLEEFIKLFDLKDLNKSSAIFDREKLLWFNSEYIKNMEDRVLTEKYLDFVEENSNLKKLDKKTIEKVIPLVKERAKTLMEIHDDIQFFFNTPERVDLGDVKGVKSYGKEDWEKGLIALVKHTGSLDEQSKKWTHEVWEEGIRKIADNLGWKHGDLFMLLRVAVVGSPFSPPLFESMQVLGKDKSLSRIESYTS